MSTAGIAANKLELLQIARAVATEKSIDEGIVLEAIEEASGKRVRAVARQSFSVFFDMGRPHSSLSGFAKSDA